MTLENPYFGQARWSALQAVEKTMKLALEVSGKTIPRTHDLHKLFATIKSEGFLLKDPQLIGLVLCEAGVRYGETSSTKRDAGDAHSSAFAICAEVSKQIVSRLDGMGN